MRAVTVGEHPTQASEISDIDRLESREAGGAAVRGGAIRVSGYFVMALAGAGSAAVVFRHLGVSAVGTYITALSIIAIVGGISDLGLTALGMREFAVRDIAGRNDLMRTLIGIRILVTVVGVCLGIAFSALAGYSSVLVFGVAVGGVALLFQNLQATIAIDLMRNLRFGWITIFEVGRQIVLALLVIALALNGAGVVSIIGASIPVAVVALAATMVLVRGDISFRPAFNRDQWVKLLRDLLPFSIAVATAVLYFRVSVVIVSLVSSSEQLGYFSTSFRVIEVLTQVPALMVGAAFPIFARAARDDHTRFAYGIERVSEVAMIVGVLFVLLLALGAPIVIGVIGGPKFKPAVGVLQIQAFALGGTFLGAVWSYALLSLRMQRELVLISIGALAAGVTLVFALTSLAGPEGAAAATAITEIGLAIVCLFVLARSNPHLVPSLGRLPRTLLAGLGAATLIFIPGLPTIVLVGAAAIVYGGLLFALRAVPDEVTVELLKWRRGRAAP